MAKVAFTKLGLTKNTSVASFEQNGQLIEVKQYLPIQEKMDLIAAVLNNCQDANNFINEAKISMYMDLEIIYRYTNISFTDKQKEDPGKLYDLLAGSGFIEDVLTVIPQNEYKGIAFWLRKTAENIYEYRNSVYGVLDAMSKDYSNLELDATKLAQEIGDPESLTLIKDVLTKMG